jgi:hypothetical protein
VVSNLKIIRSHRKSFASENETDISEAYSGDLTTFANVKKHNLTHIRRFDGNFSMARLCPPVTQYTPVSLIQSDNFNYQSNTTGKVVYFKGNTKVFNNSLYFCPHIHFSSMFLVIDYFFFIYVRSN